MRVNFHISILVCLFLTPLFLYAQESHYEVNQIGSRSSLLAGAVVSSVRDNSAIYYNPAGLSFIDNSSLSVMGDFYYYDYLQIKNALGDDISIYSHSADAIPQIFSGIYKNKEKPWLTINYAVLNRSASQSNSLSSHTDSYNIFDELPGNENFTGVYEYFNRHREDWAGIGYGYKINDKLGLGFSVFSAFRTQEFRVKYDADIYHLNDERAPGNSFANHYFYNNLRYFSVGVFSKLGIAYTFKKVKFGATLTTPRIPIKFISNSSLNRSIQIDTLATTTGSEKVQFSQNKIKTQYKSPWIFEAGTSVEIRNTIIHASLSYYSTITKYDILQTPNSGITYDNLYNTKSFTNVHTAHKHLINFALGVEHRLSSNVNVLGGFRTDFNYLNTGELDPIFDLHPNLSFYDLYHISGGTEWKQDKFNLSLGVTFSLGYMDNHPQVLEMTNPKPSNLFMGEPDNSAEAFFFRSKLIIGFTYYFPRI